MPGNFVNLRIQFYLQVDMYINIYIVYLSKTFHKNTAVKKTLVKLVQPDNTAVNKH